MKYDKKVYEQWIDAVNDEGRDLSDWEKNFMESVTDQFISRGSLSEKQVEILERIYTEKVR